MTVLPRQSLKELYEHLGIPYEEPEEEPQEDPLNHRPAMSYLKIKKTITKRTEADGDENFPEKE